MFEKGNMINELFDLMQESAEVLEDENEQEIESMESEIKSKLGNDFINKYTDLIFRRMSDHEKEYFRRGFKYATSLMLEATGK